MISQLLGCVSIHALLLFITLSDMTSGGTIAPPLSAAPVVFARNIFRALNEEEPLVNMVVSPAAVRSGLTLVFMGSGGKAAEQLRGGLILGAKKKSEIYKQHAEFWQQECTCTDKGIALKLATRIYVENDSSLRPDFNLNAAEYFNAQAAVLNYSDAESSVRNVNKWLEQQTFHTVRNLLLPSAFNDETSVILVNSLYFRAKWSHRFAVKNTLLNDFWISPVIRMQVPMMRQVGQFRYGESKSLKARMLQLPFEDSDISMLIIVPKDIYGLPELEEKLKAMDMNQLATKSVVQEVSVTLPRFRIECDIDLKVPLGKMGISRIFKPEAAELSGLFQKKGHQYISEARHKLYLDVNEAGCETDPYGEESADVVPIANTVPKQIIANRPFIFAIRNNKTVFFVGHFVRP